MFAIEKMFQLEDLTVDLEEMERRLILETELPMIWTVKRDVLFVDGVGYNKRWKTSNFDYYCFNDISQFLDWENHRVRRLEALFSGKIWRKDGSPPEKMVDKPLNFFEIKRLLIGQQLLMCYLDCQPINSWWWDYAEIED